MRSTPLTLLIALTAFKDSADADSGKVTQVTPDQATRFAFDKNGYNLVEISNQSGPKNDGKLELIDAICIGADEIDVPGYDRALIVRLESTRGLDSFVAQNIGDAVENYMNRNGTDQFATAAIGDLDQGQELHGKWNTVLLMRDESGNWSFKNLRFASVQKSTDGTYAVLRDGKMTKTVGGSLIPTLLDNDKLQAIMDGGHMLDGTKKKHLVRAPIQTGGAYSVVDRNGQTVYDNKFQVIATGQTGFTVMPAIDVDGTYTDKVTTVSGKGNTWDIRPGIPARKADSLAQAYGASA